uniref:NTF2-like domain-containing protein n=1 Tax=Caenorhabditis tropicalis TaxID=1561998 RepID=A0A1I7T1G2_9PELO
MLVRVILLTLLLLLVSDIQCGKIHKLLKSVGKRYGSAHTRHYDDNIALFKAIDRRKWESASEEQVNATKWQNAKNLVDHFLGVSSTENEHFEASFKWFEAILSVDLSAEICEDGKKLNTFQYVKYMKQIASRYERFSGY